MNVAQLPLAAQAELERRRRLGMITQPPVWRPNSEVQQAAFDCPAFELLYGGSAGGGKAISIDTPISTAEGWKTMADVQPGDRVGDEDRYYCTVIAVTPVMYGHRVFAVKFDDGSIIKADAGHLWKVERTPNGKTWWYPEILTTEKICGLLNEGFSFRIDEPCGLFEIVSIEEIPTEPVKCIQVDNPSGLYLAGKSLIPTHNSDLILGLARLAHKKSILFRRIFPDAERALVVRSLEFYGDRGFYNASAHLWRIDGRRIEIGHLERNNDIYKYQGAAYDLICFDELTQFTKLQYTYLISRARTVDKSQRVRIVSTANPGGEGNDWVMQRWAPWLDPSHANPAKSGEIRYYKNVSNDNGDVIEIETDANEPGAVSRTFIRARLQDNPALSSTDYEHRLNSLPEPFRSQLLNGDWTIGLTDDAYQVIPRAWIKAAQDRWQPGGKPEGVTPIIGADIARGGDDKTVFAPRYGDWFDNFACHPGKSTPDGQSVAGLLTVMMTGGGTANMDVIGVGASAFDIARGQGLNVTPVNFGAGSNAADQSGQIHFANKRAECYWRMREALDPHNGRNLALPPDPELLGDLSAPRWRPRTNGIIIEEKDEIKQRLGRSPDKGDAAVLALYEEVLQIFL